ncbi:pantoate--beta-alanine ligase [Nesterenkonia natronophila]|uniref:pantoate--beta-alanine ligase n=1 Tax=Nesterenkonia natronophila TaxID=2174932 RepID=UPI0018656BA3|nr:pantoate--beta-alanine ligase [Nesterenkonia natronophila]
MTQLFDTVRGIRAAVVRAAQHSTAARPVVGIVPTMGALHSGHAALLESARRSSDVLIASVFVNPLQFDDPTDYQLYPRQLEVDLQMLAEHDADFVFAPGLQEMYPGYPEGPLVRVSAGELGRRWEGASRPGHFDGVATVVTKLFTILSPPAPAECEAWFGQKDAEQLAVIRRLVTDLNLPVRIRSLPSVRDENGVALSSRNLRLSESDYDAARSLSRALFTLKARAETGGPLDLPGLRTQLQSSERIDLDYLVVVDPATLRETAQGVLKQPALALIAARVGPVRLIDTMDLRPAVPPTG